MQFFNQVTPSKETLTSWQNRPQQVVANYIKKVLALEADGQNSQIRATTVSCGLGMWLGKA